MLMLIRRKSAPSLLAKAERPVSEPFRSKQPKRLAGLGTAQIATKIVAKAEKLGSDHDPRQSPLRSNAIDKTNEALISISYAVASSRFTRRTALLKRQYLGLTNATTRRSRRSYD